MINRSSAEDGVARNLGLQLAHYLHQYTTVLRHSDGRGNGQVANGKLAALADDAHTRIVGDRIAGHSLHIVESNFRFCMK